MINLNRDSSVTKYFLKFALISILAVSTTSFADNDYGKSTHFNNEQQLLKAFHEKNSIRGSWKATVLPILLTNADGSTVDLSNSPAIINYNVFTLGGSVVGSDDIGNAVAFGDWQPLGNQKFETGFTQPTSDGGKGSIYTIHAIFTLSDDGKTFSGNFTNNLTDAKGNLLMTLDGHVNATRMINIAPVNKNYD